MVQLEFKKKEVIISERENIRRITPVEMSSLLRTDPEVYDD
jgi:hypothetical protein